MQASWSWADGSDIKTGGWSRPELTNDALACRSSSKRPEEEDEGDGGEGGDDAEREAEPPVVPELVASRPHHQGV